MQAPAIDEVRCKGRALDDLDRGDHRIYTKPLVVPALLVARLDRTH